MPAPKNSLKTALAEGSVTLGLWLNLTFPVTARIAAGSGFDWCLIDGEHAPNTIETIHAQLVAMEGQGAEPVVRVPVGEAWLLKQVLDLGAQSILIPMVDTAEQAGEMVAACRYPPNGKRGVGATQARATDYGRIPDYIQTADREICVIVQAETTRAMGNLSEIAAVEGVDVVFIGPADLSADMGYPGNPDAPEVVDAIEAGIAAIRAAGKAVGIISFDRSKFAYYRDLGVSFLGIGGDALCFAKATEALVQEAQSQLGPKPT